MYIAHAARMDSLVYFNKQKNINKNHSIVQIIIAPL